MFKHNYQGGMAVEVFSAQGQDPEARWKLHGGPSAIHKEYNKEVKGFVYCLEGDIHKVKMQIPENGKMSAGLLQRFMNLQVKIPEGRDFCVELAITSSGNLKKRLYFSTVYKDLCITEFHAKIPFAGVKQNMWTSLCIDLEAFTSELFKGTYRILDGITLSSTCQVRRIFTMKTEPTGTLEDGMFLTGSGINELLPRSCQFPKDVEHVIQLFNRNYIVNLQMAQMRTSVFNSDCVPLTSTHARSASCNNNRIQDVSHTASGFKVSGLLAETGQKTVAPSDGKDRIGHCIQIVGPLSLQMNPDITSETQNISMLSETSSPTERSHSLQKAVSAYALSGAREKNYRTRGTSGPPSTGQNRRHQPVTEKSKHQTTATLLTPGVSGSGTAPVCECGARDKVQSSGENNESKPRLTLQETLFTFPFHLHTPRQEQTISDQKKMAMTDGQVQSEIDRCCEAQLDGVLIGSESDEVNEDKRPEGVDCSVSDMHLLDSLKIHADDDEELRMLASLKREQEEDECGASGFSASQIYQSVSVSMSSDYTSTWTHIPMPANQGRHYQKEMNPLLRSNPREWMEVLSPPIMPPNQQMSSGTTGKCDEDLIKGQEESVNEEENEDDERFNLFYDPCLKHYFDPKMGKYYELA